MDKKTITHSHRHQHDGQQHTHQHEHGAIIYPDERGYTVIKKLKELDMTDLKRWKEDENNWTE